jgi:hypothetical protein
MTDLAPQHVAPAAAPPMPSLPSLSPDQVASARQDWIAAGLDVAKFDAAASGTSPEPTPPPSVDQRPEGRPDPMNLTDAQRGEMVSALLAAGMSREAVEAAVKADGGEMPGAPPPALTEEQEVFQAAFAPAAPHDIHVEYLGRISPDTDIADLAELNREATTWASEIGFPAALGAAVIERALDVGHAYERMTDVDRQLWQVEQKIDLERMAGGPEKAAEKIALATEALKRGGKAFTDGLYKSGALHDAGVILHLANQGERLQAR